jgi:multiple sugar transport system permease protein
LTLIALLLAALVMLAPLIWTLLLSLKENSELVGNSGAALSPPYTLENYASILQGNQVFRWLINSFIVSIGTTIGVLALCSLAGYGFARLDFPFRKTLFVFILLGLAIPEQAVILPQHQLFADLRLHNSYPGLILPGLAGPFGVFFMTQYFRAIPRDLDEAAMLDGASRFRTFWKVLLPLTMPAQATLGVFTFLASWNSYWWPLISATRSDMYTLTVGLASAQMNYAQTSGLGFLMAQAVFASIPIFIVYILFQKQIVRAMAGTAVR